MRRGFEYEFEAVAAPRGRGSGEYQIVGNDDRVRVTNTLAIPFRFICCLEFEFNEPASGGTHFLRGTGTLVSDRHVLTAAHNVLRDVSRDDTNFPINYRLPDVMFVAPARNDRNFHGGVAEVQVRAGAPLARVAPLWRANADRQRAGGNTTHLPGPMQADYALLTLSLPLGARVPTPTSMQLPPPPLGHWGHPRFGGGTRIRAYDSAHWGRLRNETINLSGYPGDKCRHWPLVGSATNAQLRARKCFTNIPGMEPFIDLGSTQWRSTGSILNPAQAPGLITYDLDTATGHSGSPVWLNWEGYRNLVAIHTGESGAVNRGLRITAPILQQLRAWMIADGVRPTF